MIVPGSIKVMGHIPRTMRNFLREHISDGGVLKFGGGNGAPDRHNFLYDLESQRVGTWPIPGLPGSHIALWAFANFDVMAPFEEQEMGVRLDVHQEVNGGIYHLVFRWRISYGKLAGDDLLAVWPGAKNTLNEFLQQCYTLPPQQIIPHDAYTQEEVAEIGKQNLERMQKILGGFD